MWIFLLSLLVYVPMHFGDKVHEHVNFGFTLKYSEEVSEIVTGDFLSIMDLFIPFNLSVNKNQTNNATKTEQKHINQTKEFEVHFDDSDIPSDDFVVHEYNELSKNGRRYFSINDPEDNDYKVERKKQVDLRQLVYQWLVHSRHELAKALRQRQSIRQDKRYKLGYLFNRLRRIKTEQFKLIWMVHERQQSEYQQTYTYHTIPMYCMIMYEKIAAYDVDSKDTCNLIENIFKTKEDVDFIIEKDPKRSHKKDNFTRKDV